MTQRWRKGLCREGRGAKAEWVRNGTSSSSTAAPPVAGRVPLEPNGVATPAKGSSSVCAAAVPSMAARVKYGVMDTPAGSWTCSRSGRSPL